jgi:3-methyladenine DNA glycosylase AlkD
MDTARDVEAALAAVASATDAAQLQRYFKTGPGEYGENDVFIGVRVPRTREIAKRFRELPPSEIDALLDSAVHEHRLAGLIILNVRAKRHGQECAELYLAAVRRGRVNNWDLVDSSAEHVLGAYLLGRPRGVLFELAASPVLWERRVAVLATFAFIKAGDASATLELAALLLRDPEDLMQKAVGWMLREVGNRVDERALLDFLDEHAAAMPRTMLSYAVERLGPAARAYYRALR